METTDRFKQMSWLRELAGDIANYAGQGSAEEMVEHWLSEWHEGGVALPSWFDENDRRLLTEMVRRRIA